MKKLFAAVASTLALAACDPSPSPIGPATADVTVTCPDGSNALVRIFNGTNQIDTNIRCKTLNRATGEVDEVSQRDFYTPKGDQMSATYPKPNIVALHYTPH